MTLLIAPYTALPITFRVIEAELTILRLFILLSLAHGAVDLLERLSARKFRTPKSMRLIADMSIQMILGESIALMTAVGFIQLYNFTYPSDNSPPSTIYNWKKKMAEAHACCFYPDRRNIVLLRETFVRHCES